MSQKIIPTLYIDTQSLVPQNCCRDCGAVCFGKLCLRCERNAP